eukprot:TRINITY_DN4579_c0_g2_i1.p1 TRINITY_DN4579_c0_g2~~TRINITY_DN4579_c0_g2_i1.p1  ORF type:complete len:390 (+),score=122.24 TRINITY_DN4579_c0_g2_i1:39-1172(+)
MSKSGVKAAFKIGEPECLEKGKKRYKIHTQYFDVDGRYSVTRVVGFGAYGTVCGAIDMEAKKKSGQKVAIKKCQNVFRDLGDCKRILREIKLLRFLKQENLLSLRNLLEPLEGKDGFKDIYLVTELFDTDLSNVIQSQQQMNEEHYQYFIYQILRGLKYLHSANVMHRDLKPANIIVNINCDLKICDFGLSRGFSSTEKMEDFTDYVVTRWYRPPELLLMCTNYSPAIDIWSAGCIFTELLSRKTLFPGKDYLHMLNMICDYLGVPSEDDMSFLHHLEAAKYIRALPNKGGRALSDLVPALAGNELALDFVRKMLLFNPEKRSSAAELLLHPYLECMHDPDDEPVAERKFDWEFDSHEFSEEQLRDAIWEEIQACKP